MLRRKREKEDAEIEEEGKEKCWNGEGGQERKIFKRKKKEMEDVEKEKDKNYDFEKEKIEWRHCKGEEDKEKNMLKCTKRNKEYVE